jgi:hypothetical protein
MGIASFGTLLPDQTYYLLLVREGAYGNSTCTPLTLYTCGDVDADGVNDCIDPCTSGPNPGTSCDDGNPHTMNDVVNANCNCIGTYVSVVVYAGLEGAAVSPISLMHDSLRTHGLIPLTEPYTALGYDFMNSGGAESISPGLLDTTGALAIVDWVVIELRSATDPTVVLASRAGLLKRNGRVMTSANEGAFLFPVLDGSYYVAVRHRNHLGCMSLDPIALAPLPVFVDFRSSSTATYGGTAARKDINGTMMLWAGDVNFDGTVKYTGSSNDRDPILLRIGGSTPTNFVNGYFPEDVNLDGKVKYTGTANDRDPILLNIGGSTPTNTRADGLP